jgi:hypothetical protein
MTKDAYQVETFNATTGQTTSRTITPLPTPQRIQPAPVITKGELTELIDSLRNEMSEQQTRFDNRAQIDAERTARKNELHLKIIDLNTQLNATQTELDQLKRVGTVRQEFIQFSKNLESRVTSIANGVYNFLLEKISLERHEATYKELTPLLKEDVRFRVDRCGIRFLTQGSFATLHRAPADKISDARITQTLEKVYDASEKLEKALQK